ncbi:hypothetical protein [Comamonas sp. F1-6]|uniref:hypothetical protein n=1 Tax=Comamonas sp. F1-6 TaxID=673550 RepID=UPI0031D994FA
MVVTVKIDGRLVLLTAIYLSIGIGALLLAFPDASIWVPSNSSELASWFQAVGSLFAIAATWYIASSDRRERRENEHRLAALDASTMHAELWGALMSLGTLRTEMVKIYMSKDLSNINQLSPRLSEVRVRPLADQKNLSLVGASYLSEISEILRRLSVLKNDLSLFKFLKDLGDSVILFRLKESIECAAETEVLIAKASATLNDFAARQGIPLNYLH